MTESSTRRRQLTDAAIETLAVAGLRGLTHRAVDQAAGVPEGSCSYYFRTRQALLQAALDRLLEADTADIVAPPEMSGDGGAETIAETAAVIVQHWTTTARSRTVARHELALEATRRPELGVVLQIGAAHVRRSIVDLLAAAGIPEPDKHAPLIVAFIDGFILERLTGPGELDLDPIELRTTLLRLMSALST
ncbi:TetR family transcriptional regulator [Nonomuraea sp. NPDC000554]|uniref:TetR/AcrR family transcriptional regulator n=1 Tax=Nonomuraea sp. NPDC000554 TaxID=3154259 RepID=UPI003332FEB4